MLHGIIIPCPTAHRNFVHDSAKARKRREEKKDAQLGFYAPVLGSAQKTPAGIGLIPRLGIDHGSQPCPNVANAVRRIRRDSSSLTCQHAKSCRAALSPIQAPRHAPRDNYPWCAGTMGLAHPKLALLGDAGPTTPSPIYVHLLADLGKLIGFLSTARCTSSAGNYFKLDIIIRHLQKAMTPKCCLVFESVALLEQVASAVLFVPHHASGN